MQVRRPEKCGKSVACKSSSRASLKYTRQRTWMAFEVREHPTKGRGLYATRLIKGGEQVLEEAPLLLLVAPEHALSTCANCLRLIQHGSALQCGSCQQACFCSPACSQQGTATPWVHSPGVCRAYLNIAGSGLSQEDQGALRFLVHAMCLRQIQSNDPEQRYQNLLSLTGVPRPEDLQTAQRLLPALSSALGVNPDAGVEELATLLRKEQLNSYGILAPHGPEGTRQLRGSGVYMRCALINHECNPNVARFDAFDSGSSSLSFRAMHDLPAGSEITQSYCPLNWSFEERQQQCREVYGFACNCPRCQCESQGTTAGSEGSDWESGDEDDGMDEDDGAQQGGSGQQSEALRQLPPNADEGAMEPTYLQLFLLKYMCPVPSCFGTLAPLAAEHGQPDVMECNVCRARRTEAQFMSELEQGQ